MLIAQFEFKFAACSLINMKNMDKNISCPKCSGLMTFQGVQSVGAGAARIFNVDVYLCSKCGCKGRYDDKTQKVIEIQN
jgi:DNA-directed RNA polymerase subunit RPC12/RpoP